jgi:hypothetical protein
MKTYDVEFTMTFTGQIHAESDDEAREILFAIETGQVWENADGTWLMDSTERRITDSHEED